MKRANVCFPWNMTFLIAQKANRCLDGKRYRGLQTKYSYLVVKSLKKEGGLQKPNLDTCLNYFLKVLFCLCRLPHYFLRHMRWYLPK